ncbi:MAG: class I SAM-dependent methyltransferase [Actinomycetota bacterium]|nr:class I SAM-dependent methyltransferase [Actinomycetota bacterium]
MTSGPAMAAAYDRGRGLHPRDIERWMTAAGPYLPTAGGRVLDMGAGTGRFSDALARFSTATVVACELSAAMRAVFRAGSPHAALVGGVAAALPFRARTFDAVWASQMIHHVRDLPAFAAELRRVLQPSVHVLIRAVSARRPNSRSTDTSPAPGQRAERPSSRWIRSPASCPKRASR